jgi:hypothetical protein
MSFRFTRRTFWSTAGTDFQEIGFSRNGVPATYDHVPIWHSVVLNIQFAGSTIVSVDAPDWAID